MRLIVIALIALLGVVAFTALAPQPDPTPVIDHTATVTYLPEEAPEEPKCENQLCLCEKCKCKECKCGMPTLRAYVVTVCKNPKCKDHGAFARELQRLSSWGDKLRVLANNDPTDAAQIKNLNIPCDAFSYVVLTDGLNVHVKPWPKNADEIGNWLLATAKEKHPALEWGVAGDVPPLPEPVAETHSAPAVSSLLTAIVVSGGDRCPPCRVMKRDQAEIEAEIGASLTVLMDDADSGERTSDGKPKTVAQKYHVDAVPTTIVLMDGKEIDRTTGYSGKRGFCRWLKNVAEKHGGRWK